MSEKQEIERLTYALNHANDQLTKFMWALAVAVFVVIPLVWVLRGHC